MTAGYTKLFGSLISSSCWNEPHHVRVLWVTMLALKNREQVVEGSPAGLAVLARLTLEECQDGLRVLSSPDVNSRSKDDEGRRIREIPEIGWFIINGAKFRDRLTSEDRREYQRNYMRKRRARLVNSSQPNIVNGSMLSRDPDPDPDPDPIDPPVVPLAGDAPQSRKPKGSRARTALPAEWAPTEEHRLRALQGGLDVSREAERFRTHAEATGRLMASWTAAFTMWLEKAGEFQSRGPARSDPKPPAHTEFPRDKRPGRIQIPNEVKGLIAGIGRQSSESEAES